MISKAVVYYTDSRLDDHILLACQRQLKSASGALPIISVSLKPLNFGQNIVLPLERGYLTMFKQILTGLEAADADVIFFAEHDVLYAPDYFLFHPMDMTKIYYNMNLWQLRLSDGHAVYYIAKRTSQICAYRDVLVEHYRRRVHLVEKNGFSRRMGFEPASHGRAERVDDLQSDVWQAHYPNIDVKHGQNLTEARWCPAQFRSPKSCQGWQEGDDLPYWGSTEEVARKLRFNVCII